MRYYLLVVIDVSLTDYNVQNCTKAWSNPSFSKEKNISNSMHADREKYEIMIFFSI